MLRHGFQAYMDNAFPSDELLPLSCKGKNTYGGYALTVVDALDTLAVLGEKEKFRWVVTQGVCLRLWFLTGGE